MAGLLKLQPKWPLTTRARSSIVQSIVATNRSFPPGLSAASYSALCAPLTGRSVRLVPLVAADTERLHAAFADDDLWEWSTVAQPPPSSPEQTAQWVNDALAAGHAQTQVPFIIETLDGKLAGTTRYMDLRWHDGGVEIGHTMVFAPFRRTHLNTETKYLLLRRAFQELGFSRVQLKTDARNVRSRTAIARIGAQYEGTLRCLQRRYNGEIRDTAFFSITFSEWPHVRASLEKRLEQRPAQAQ